MNLDVDRFPAKARTYIAIIVVLGLVVLAQAAMNWESPDLLKFGGFLMVAVFSSGMRLNVPGVNGTLSMAFLFVLFGVIELSGPETVVIGAILTVAQCYWSQPTRPRIAKVIFNVTAMSLAIIVTERVYHLAERTQCRSIHPPGDCYLRIVPDEHSARRAPDGAGGGARGPVRLAAELLLVTALLFGRRSHCPGREPRSQ
jgi:hypothetical protein